MKVIQEVLVDLKRNLESRFVLNFVRSIVPGIAPGKKVVVDFSEH